VDDRFYGFDTRNLLTYSDSCRIVGMLFGMRGGLLTGKSAEGALSDGLRRDFEKFFSRLETCGNGPIIGPAMVCFLSRAQYAVCPEACPDPGGLYASLGYTMGTVVAMGSYSGGLIADLVWTNPSTGPTHRSCKTRCKKVSNGGGCAGLLNCLWPTWFCASRLLDVGATGLAWLADCLNRFRYIFL